MDTYKQKPPALTLGLPLFLIVVYLFNHLGGAGVAGLALGRDNFLHPAFDTLNRLSFYPVAHLNVLHLAFNILALFPLIREFELVNGTVRTGVILNVLSVFPGISYGVICVILRYDAQIVGASGWVFSFLAYSAWKKYLVTPALPIPHVSAPTWTYPLVTLAITTVIFPFSSLLGHVIGLVFGYLLAWGYLGFAIDGTSTAVRWIESHIVLVIGALSHLVVWVKEVDVRPVVDEGHVLGGEV